MLDAAHSQSDGEPTFGGVIAVVGDNCIDVYQGDPVRAAVGGNALNVAVNLRRRGMPSLYIGEIGDDENAKFIRQALDDAGVDCSQLRQLSGPSWLVSIVLCDGDSSVEFEVPGAANLYRLRPEEVALLGSCKHVHLANLAEPAAALAALAQAGAPVSYDYGSVLDPAALGPTDVAFISYRGGGGELEAGRMAQIAVEGGARLAMVTMGPAGSLAFDGKDTLLVPVEPVEPVDTLGAGDSFIATFLAERLRGVPLEAAMKSANRDAAATCLHWAAWPQVPLLSTDGGWQL